jgi:predicted metal-dependent hydrolase
MSHAGAGHAILPRRVRFDFDGVPRHWLDGRPGLTHQANALHLVFPPGERWFVRTANKALPQLTDPALAAATRGFLGQEALHARSHESFFDTLRGQGFPVDEATAVLEREFKRRERLLPFRLQLAVISGIELYTAALGAWAFERHVFDGAHPALADLFLWHAAEEIEHKCVAFDLREALAPGYLRRILGLVLATIGVLVAWTVLGLVLVKKDPETTFRAAGKDLRRAFREGKSPFGYMARAFLLYLRPSFHPSQSDDLRLAADYLARSPAVRALSTQA